MYLYWELIESMTSTTGTVRPSSSPGPPSCMTRCTTNIDLTLLQQIFRDSCEHQISALMTCPQICCLVRYHTAALRSPIVIQSWWLIFGGLYISTCILLLLLYYLIIIMLPSLVGSFHCCFKRKLRLSISLSDICPFLYDAVV